MENRPYHIAQKLMYEKDAFSQWLGIEIVNITEGYCKLRMVIGENMTNGFDIAHGGIAFSLADSALAFASNSYGMQAVSIETSISYTRPIKRDDTVTAETSELHRSNKLAIYDVKLTNQLGRVMALFKGTVYYTGKDWD